IWCAPNRGERRDGGLARDHRGERRHHGRHPVGPREEVAGGMMSDNPLYDWARECDRARDDVLEQYHKDPGECGDLGIEKAKRLLAVAHQLKGVACPRCHGFGERAYPTTATWHLG